MILLKSAVLTLVFSICSGCMCMYAHMPNYATYYYDDWYGYFSSRIKWLRNDEVYQFSIGYERPSSGRRQGYDLPPDEIPIFPDFIKVDVERVSFTLDALTPELADKISLDEPYKAGFFHYGDSVYYMAKELDVTFCNGRPVYFFCGGTNVVFRNIRTGESGSLPMSVRKMKAIFGSPSRMEKKVVW